MEPLDELEDAPLTEPIHTTRHDRQEVNKKVRAQVAKRCYKHAYARKQALTQKNTLIKRGYAKYLRVYKCKRCHSWHLTSQEERQRHAKV